MWTRRLLPIILFCFLFSGQDWNSGIPSVGGTDWSAPVGGPVSKLDDWSTPTVANSGTTITISSYSASAGSNRAVCVMCGGQVNNGGRHSTATFGGQSMTEVIEALADGGTYDDISAIYCILDSNFPGGDSGDIVVTLSAATFGHICSASTWENVSNWSGTCTDGATSCATSLSCSITVDSDAAMIAVAESWDSTAPISWTSGDTTEQWEDSGSSFSTVGGSEFTSGTGASQTAQANFSTCSTSFGNTLAAAELIP